MALTPRDRFGWRLIVAAVAGLVLITAGVAWIFPPAGLIVAGLSLVGSAYLIAEEREQ